MLTTTQNMCASLGKQALSRGHTYKVHLRCLWAKVHSDTVQTDQADTLQ